jgi:hypothetical protein
MNVFKVLIDLKWEHCIHLRTAEMYIETLVALLGQEKERRFLAGQAA